MALVLYKGKYIPIKEWEAIFESMKFAEKDKGSKSKKEEDVQNNTSEETQGE